MIDFKKFALTTPAVVLTYLAAAAAGGILSLAFPPVHESGTAWLAPAALIVLSRFSKPKRAFGLGFVFGFVFWCTSLNWMTKLSENGGPAILVYLGIFGLSAWCSVFSGGFGFLVSRIWRNSAASVYDSAFWDAVRAVAVAIFWAGLEYLRAVLFTGFGWNTLAVSQFENLPLAQLASVGGVYAVSFVVMLVNAAIAGAAVRIWRRLRFPGTEKYRINADLLTALAALAVSLLWGTAQIRTLRSEYLSSAEMTRIAVVDPLGSCAIEDMNIAFWKEIYADMKEKTRTAAILHPDIIVWPETSLPYTMPDIDFSADTCGLARETEAPILAGTIEAEEDPAAYGGVRFYNSSFLFKTNGIVNTAYRKRHLVPFGEYIPLDRFFGSLSRLSPGGFSCSPGDGAALFTFGNSVIGGCLICFEDTIPNLAADTVRAGAKVLFSLSNDAWFWGSCEPVQHHANAVFRAIETRVPLVRCSNKGLSSVVRPWGESTGIINGGFFVQTIGPGNKNSGSGLYARFGDWLFGIPAMAVTLISTACMLFLKSDKGGKSNGN